MLEPLSDMMRLEGGECSELEGTEDDSEGEIPESELFWTAEGISPDGGPWSMELPSVAMSENTGKSELDVQELVDGLD